MRATHTRVTAFHPFGMCGYYRTVESTGRGNRMAASGDGSRVGRAEGVPRESVFSSAVAEFRKAGVESAIADRRLLEDLIYGWHNESWSAYVDFLQASLVAASEAHNPILECGSGLTTCLMGLVTSEEAPIVALEHKTEWADRVRSFLLHYDIDNVEVVESPLVDYGQYSWYDITNIPLLPRFGLVICDGPPGDTPGGRYGLLPVAGSLLSTDCRILLDDIEREGEQRVVELWKAEFSLNRLAVHHTTEYAVLALGGE